MATEQEYWPHGTKRVEIFPSGAKTVTGNSEEFWTFKYNSADVFLKATADTALTSLNVHLQTWDQVSNDWATIASFSTITSTPSTLEPITRWGALGEKCRIRYVLVGTSVTFSVNIILKP